MQALKNAKILIVDDEKLLREVLQDLFSDAGAEVAEADSQTGAIELAQTNKFDVIITDYRMPGGSGTDLITALEKVLTTSPAIFLYSGFAETINLPKKTKLKYTVIQKPFDTLKLLELIAGSLTHKK